MDVEQTRLILRNLPHVAETMQWGAKLVYWAGDKAVGGKMFALMDLEEGHRDKAAGPVLAFAAGPERYAELLEVDGALPAPYMARLGWIALADWHVFTKSELTELLTAAHAQVLARLPQKTLDILALPKKERDRVVREQQAVRTAKGEAKSALKAAANQAKKVPGPAGEPKKRSRQSASAVAR